MRNIFIAVGAAGAVLITSITAAAQTTASRPERPYRGLFGPETSMAADVLSVSGSMGAGYESDVVLDLPADDSASQSGPTDIGDAAYATFSGGLSYMRDREAFDLGASVSSSGRYYPEVSGNVMTSHSAAGGVSFQLTDSTRVTASQLLVYQPWQVFTAFPTLFASPLGQPLLPNQDFAAGGTEYISYSTSGSVMQRLSRRAFMEAGYAYQGGSFSTNGGSLDGDFATQSAWARFSRSITRSMAARIGYTYTEFRFNPDTGRYRGDTLDAGIDYSRELSITRRTKVWFGTGATGVRDNHVTRYGATGTAGISREIARTWLAAATYSRNVIFVEWLRAPYFYDGFNLGLNGLINRKVSFHSNAGATLGTLGLSQDAERGNRLDTGYASAGILFAISRHLATSVDYVFYVYTFDPLTTYANYNLTPHLSRHGVRVSLNAWAPIFERGRRSNATR
jgi:hypothetical protein